VKDAEKLLEVFGAAVFAVFIVLYRLNAARENNAGIWPAQWLTTAEWQLGVVVVGLLVAVIGIAMTRLK
jgi:hypothetical protein